MRLSLGSSEDRRKKKQEEISQSKDDSTPSFAKSPKSFFIELIKIVVIALAISIPIRYFLFQPFYVRGASMEPTFQDSEYLIIDEITYRFSDPERGDVIVVRNPQHESEFFIKRIIALPSETISIEDGVVTIFSNTLIDGLLLEETYLGDGVYTSGTVNIKLDEDEYYVLGDNRSVSLDSRAFGPLEKEYLVGRAWLRVWPFDRFQHFVTPDYQISGM